MNGRTSDAHPRDRLPRPVTFFLTERERREVLRALRVHGKGDRASALCRALGVERGG